MSIGEEDEPIKNVEEAKYTYVEGDESEKENVCSEYEASIEEEESEEKSDGGSIHG